MKAVIGLLVCFLCHSAWAVVETWEFRDDQQRERYQRMIDELRCPKCQNQNLSGSDAPIAADLRRELYRMLQEDYSDEEIIDFMVERYGEFVLYRPPFDRNTALLWLGPFLLLLVGAVIIGFILRRSRPAGAAEPLTEREQQAIADLLKKDTDE